MEKNFIVFLFVFLLTLVQLFAGGLSASQSRILSVSKRFLNTESMTAEECYEKYQKYHEIADDYIYENNDDFSDENIIEKKDSDANVLEEKSDTNLLVLEKDFQDLIDQSIKRKKQLSARTAIIYLMSAAEKGMAKAQYEYAEICLKKNTEESNKLAVEYLSKAAEQEYAPAYKELAECYKNGIGTEVDKKKSKQYQRLYKKAEKNK